MKHKHHIIPRHIGGTDDPDNIVELTIAEHSEAHRLLYEEYGREEDRIAWLGLAALIGQDELLVEKSRMGGKKNQGVPKSDKHKAKIGTAIASGAGYLEEHTAETKEKISKKMKGNKNSANHSSEEYKKKQSKAMKAAWARKKQNSQ